jgi:biofilm protein TabA
MIADKIENAKSYSGLSKRLKKALELLQDKTVIEAKDGKYFVDGDNLFYLVMHYTTKSMEQCRLEKHKNYIDIQLVADGREIIGYAPAGNLTVTEKYNPEKDVEFYKTPDDMVKINLDKGMFGIFFPHDAHMPKCQLKSPSNVLKIVVKVKTNG